MELGAIGELVGAGAVVGEDLQKSSPLGRASSTRSTGAPGSLSVEILLDPSVAIAQEAALTRSADASATHGRSAPEPSASWLMA